jgi:hypothetical protein
LRTHRCYIHIRFSCRLLYCLAYTPTTTQTLDILSLPGSIRPSGRSFHATNPTRVGLCVHESSTQRGRE